MSLIKKQKKTVLFEQVTILGLGLIGGSIALDLKKRGLAKRVVGFNRTPQRRRIAKTRGACDEVYPQAAKAVRGSGLIILATPVQTIPQIAREVVPHLEPGAILTDVGSTKEHIVREMKKILPKEIVFVGGHPIAGTENSGMESALPGLFQDRWWLFTPGDSSAAGKRALRKCFRLAKALGAKTASLSSKKHDEALAVISHLPHMVAYSLMDTALKLHGGKVLRFAAGGFRDYTRIAASSPQMWSEICLDNSEQILRMIGRFEKSLGQIKNLITKRDKRGLSRFFEKTSKVRKKL